MPTINAKNQGQLSILNETSWAAARDGATGESSFAIGSNTQIGVARASTTSYTIRRAFYEIDTSIISASGPTPTSAEMSWTYKRTTGAPGPPFGNFNIVRLDQSVSVPSPANIFAFSDYGKVDFNTVYTDYADGITSLETVGVATAVTATLNTQALLDMKSYDRFLFCIIYHYFDLNNNAPGSNGNRYYEFTNDLKLTYVEGVAPAYSFTASAGGPAFGSDYVMRTYSIDVLSDQYDRDTEQIPFSLGTPGPLSLRGRNNAPTIGSGDKKN